MYFWDSIGGKRFIFELIWMFVFNVSGGKLDIGNFGVVNICYYVL